jgi:hypothetical protein
MTRRDLAGCSAVAVALLMVASCAGQQTALEPTDRTAVVKATPWGKVYRGGYVEIASVNGVQPSWRLRSEMELDAGDQTAVFYVYLCNGGMRDCMSVAQAQVSFRAEPKHTYRARAREQINGSNRFWVWVEDEIDGKWRIACRRAWPQSIGDIPGAKDAIGSTGRALTGSACASSSIAASAYHPIESTIAPLAKRLGRWNLTGASRPNLVRPAPVYSVAFAEGASTLRSGSVSSRQCTGHFTNWRFEPKDKEPLCLQTDGPTAQLFESKSSTSTFPPNSRARTPSSRSSCRKRRWFASSRAAGSSEQAIPTLWEQEALRS